MASKEDPFNSTSTEELEETLGIVASRFKDTMSRTFQRIDHMKLYDESGSAEVNEISQFREEAEKISQRWFGDSDSQFNHIMRGSAAPSPDKFSRTRTEKTITDLERDFNVLCTLSEKLNKAEERLKKYNLQAQLLGHCYSSETPETCLENLAQFMRLNWREPAERLREKGYKCLMDIVLELSSSGDEEKRTVSRELAGVLAHLGAEVSRLLLIYLLTVSASISERDVVLELVKEVEAVIWGLSIEQGSVVILGFVEVVRLFGRTVKDRWSFKRSGPEVKEFLRAKREGRVFRLVAMEILRLEVSFRSPDVGFVPESRMLLSMGRHLLENVFEEKLGKVRDSISFLEDDFVSITDCESILSFYNEFLDLGVREEWNKLCLSDT